MKREKILFNISWLCTLFYLILIFDAYVISLKLGVLEFVREIAVVPITLAQFVILVMCLIYWVKNGFKIKVYLFWAIVFSFCNCIFIIASFLGYIR